VYVGQHLSFARYGKATAGRPRSEPDWGNPTVRDRRGACGNVDQGGIRIPPRISKERVLETLHLPLRAPQFYPDPFTAIASAHDFHAPSPEAKASRRAACLTVF